MCCVYGVAVFLALQTHSCVNCSCCLTDDLDLMPESLVVQYMAIFSAQKKKKYCREK